MSNIFRVFVSSTFSDMVAERNALQEDVFPRLRAWCRTKGVTFQAIDLRWGISQEAGLNQRATDVCLNEIARCQKSTNRPNFLLLMGDRYGWRPLPDDIPAGEWDEFIPHITNPDDQNLLNQWYKRDDNAVPPLYVLQKRTGEFVDYPRWAEVENRLQTILWDAIGVLNWDERTRMKYETSVTEQEIQAGIFDYAHADEGAICFFRTIHNLPDDKTAKDYRDMKNGVPDTHAQARLTALKNRIRAHIPNNVHEYDATWRGDKPDIDLKAFCDRVYAVLEQAIKAEIATQQSLTAQQIEQNAHDAFRDERGRLVIGRDDVLSRVGAYIRSDNQSPLVLFGQSGVGKSSVMARAIPDDAIYRFIGVTPQSPDIRQLVYGLCEHIATRYGISETIPQDYDELIEAFPKFLAFATADKPLVIFLDALDQLSDANAPYNLRWLPKGLPPHVKLVMSVIPSKYLTALQRQLPAENLIEIPPLAQTDADTLLDRWLADVNRTVQLHQRHEIMTKFAHTGLPLYLKLAFEEAKLWRSYDTITPLHEDVPSLIRHNLFGRLSDKAEHGELLVNRSLAYLRASRNGLTEDEILELLTADKTYWDDFYAKSFHKEALDVIGGVPIVIWSRLYFDLAPYMTQRSADGTALWALFHRQFNEVVDATYLSDDVRQDRHAHIAKYFMEQDLYAGEIPNARKVSEQAYQQAMAGMKDEYVTTLTTYKFLQASLDVNGVLALIDDCGLMQDKTVRLIQSALSMSAHVLVNDKRALAHQLAGRLMHYYTKMDEIRDFLDVVMTMPNNLFPLNPASEYVIMNPAGGMLLRTMENEGGVSGVIQLHDGRILSWAGNKTSFGRKNNTLYLWNSDGTPIATLVGHTNRVTGAIELSDRRLLSWSVDKTLHLWESDGTSIAILMGHSDDVTGAIELSDRRLLSWSADKTLRLWETNGTPIATLIGHKDKVTGAIGLSDGRLLSWSADKTLHLWNEKGMFIVTMVCSSNILGALELRNNRLLSWGGDKALCLWDENGTLIATLIGHMLNVGGAIELRNGRILSWAGSALGYPDNTLCLWESDGAKIATLTGHIRSVGGAIELRNGRILSWGDDKTLRLWETDGTPLALLEGHTDRVNGVLELGDGRLLSWSADDNLRLWEADGTLVTVLAGHTKAVRGVIELWDGRVLSWSYDDTLRLWDTDGASVGILTGHMDSVRGTIELKVGGVLSWSNDKTLRLWDMNGTPIDVLEQSYYSEDRTIIGSWAEKHNFDLEELYSKSDRNIYIGSRKLKWDPLRKRDMLRIVDIQTGEIAHTFYADAPISYPIVTRNGIVVTGDDVGRVLFLRWVGEDGS